MSRIALCGTGGVGKTSLVNILTEELGIPIVNEGVREYLKENNITHLRELDTQSTKKMQEHILAVKMKNESGYDHFISDRSSLDNAAYALRWCDRDKSMQEWLLNYVDSCIEHASKAYDHIFFVPTRIFPVEDDGIRSSQEAYHYTMHLIIRGLIDEMTSKYTKRPRISTVTKVSIRDRVEEIKRKIWNRNK